MQLTSICTPKISSTKLLLVIKREFSLWCCNWCLLTNPYSKLSHGCRVSSTAWLEASIREGFCPRALFMKLLRDCKMKSKKECYIWFLEVRSQNKLSSFVIKLFVASIHVFHIRYSRSMQLQSPSRTKINSRWINNAWPNPVLLASPDIKPCLLTELNCLRSYHHRESSLLLPTQK